MEKKILIVDDIDINRGILSNIFSNKYNIVEAANGQEAIDLLSKGFIPNIMLLDIVMPIVDGFGVLDYMIKHNLKERIPVVVLTGENISKNMKRAYDLGVNDVIEKPFDSYIVMRRIENLLDLYEHRNSLEKLVNEQTTRIKAQAERLNELNYRIIDTLGTIVEFRNLESGTHIFRVREFTKILLTAYFKDYPDYSFSTDDINMISYASAMHDIGKIAIPDSILLKPGKLTFEEFELMKKHTTMGDEIIQNISGIVDKDYIKYCSNIARSHHERYDGKGYPDGLKGDEIPFEAQVVSIADVYDALVNERVYKVAYSSDEARRMILNGECGEFNPKLLSIFEKVRPEFEQVIG